MYLTGNYTHNIDAKSRITLPVAIRKQFDDKVCLVPFKDCLYGFSPEAHEAWMKSLFPDGFNPRKEADVKLRRRIAESTLTLELDSAGRIALGKVNVRDLEKAGIKREVTVLGNIDHFELWDAERYEAESQEIEDSLDELLFG